MGTDMLHARDLMTRKVVTVPPDMPVTVLARLLAERGISAAPVTDTSGTLLGIVTEADLLRRLATAEEPPRGWLTSVFRNANQLAERFAKTHGRTARDVMTTDVVTVGPDTTAEHCAHLIEERRVKRLPVLHEGQLAGVISRTDLLRAVVEPPGRIGTAAEARDQRIRAALQAEMRAQPWADDLYTYAEVRDGVVKLHGFVRSAAMRRGLRVLAERIDGVERVEDLLEDAAFLARDVI